MNICMYIYTYICMYTHMRWLVAGRKNAGDVYVIYMYTCTCIYVYMYIYIYICFPFDFAYTHFKSLNRSLCPTCTLRDRQQVAAVGEAQEAHRPEVDLRVELDVLSGVPSHDSRFPLKSRGIQVPFMCIDVHIYICIDREGCVYMYMYMYANVCVSSIHIYTCMYIYI